MRQFRLGLPLDVDDLATLVDPMLGDHSRVVFIDWVAVGDRLFFVALRPGATPYVEQLALAVSTVQRFVTEYLNERTFRLTLRDMPEQLRTLDSLLAPIPLVAQRDDILILSPSGALHALPLHALEMDGEPLIARNPIVYTPSLSVLRQCVVRNQISATLRSAALFGDPSDDTAQAIEIVQRLAATLAG